MNSRVYIETYQRDKITYLKDSFSNQPFKIADVRENHQNPCLNLMLMSSSPGLLGGDYYEIDVQVKAGGALRLKTQAYQRIFTMDTMATQTMTIKVKEGSFFHFTPHPVVPHKDSSFKGVNHIYLSKNADLIWGEVITCGRKLNDEQFAYNYFENKTTIYQNNQPVIIDHLLYHPKKKMPLSLGQLEGHTHLSSLWILQEGIDIKRITKVISEYLAAYQQLTYGVSETPISGVVVKILGKQSEMLFDVIQQLADKIYLEFFAYDIQ